MAVMTTSPAGRDAIREREGCKLHAYLDSVQVWTIGVGHTGRAAPPRVYKGMVISRDDADRYLAADLRPMEAAVLKAVAPHVATQNQFDACVSLAFNVGPTAFAHSTVAREMRAGDMQAAADAFLSWDRAGGHVLEPLLTRRKAERAQFLSSHQPAALSIPNKAKA